MCSLLVYGVSSIALFYMMLFHIELEYMFLKGKLYRETYSFMPDSAVYVDSMYLVKTGRMRKGTGDVLWIGRKSEDNT